MIKDFQDAIILTTQEPGAFLNFRWESGDPSYYFIPAATNDVSIDKLWINGLDVGQDASVYDNSSEDYYIHLSNTGGDPSIASFFLYTRAFENFDINLQIKRHEASIDGILTTYDVSVLNRPYISENINAFETSNLQVEDDTSYLILRTNPKFSGNIKLVIDPSNNLFFDTFKVSDILSNKLYRKQKISANSIFSGDVRRVFSSLPLGELYKLDDEDTLDIAIPRTDYYKQYNLNYSYGARLFKDELYAEDYAMLAPLWINNTLPDYFTIFRIPGVYNDETDNLATKFLEEGEIVKSWGIKETLPLGIYLRNHLDEFTQISPMFLSLSDPDTIKDPDPNTWYGVAVDKGIITGRSETTYAFDKKSSNFTDLNAFSSGGFERLNLLCPNLINLEYTFNDSDVSLYTMQRYYGLYLTENPLYEIIYYADTSDSSVNIISLDGKDSSIFFSSSIFDIDGSIIDIYKNRLFTLNSPLSVTRITNVNQINGTVKENVEEWLNKPGDNIFSINVENIDNLLPFISFEIKNELVKGEHLRIIDNTAFAIWEIYGVDTDILNAGEAMTYASEYSSDGYPTIYRTVFSTKGNKEDQNTAIWDAWNIFQDYTNTPFTTYKKKTYGQSLVLEDWAYGNDIKFQRLTAQTTDIACDPSSGFNSFGNYEDIEFYGIFTPLEEDFQRVRYDSSYGPINFELFGDRMSITIDIFDPSDYTVYSMDASIKDLFEDKMLYLGSDYWYRLVQYVDVSTAINHSFRYLEDPTSIFNNLIVITEEPIITVNNKWNSYTVYPLTISLMGINPVKDFDYTVYDSSVSHNDMDFKSEYWYKREGDSSTFNFYVTDNSSGTLQNINSFKIIDGSGVISIGEDSSTFNVINSANPFIFNTFDNSAFIDASSATVITHSILDGSTTFKSYLDGVSEENIYNYYLNYDPSATSKKLKYGLTTPTITKWAGIGNDCRNNPLRLILDTSVFDVSTNFIPYGDNFNRELFYPSFKYLSSGERNWEDYVFFDINDSFADGSTYTSFKELMFSNPELDVFSKLVYSNDNVDGTKLRSSTVYYNNYKDSIDTILGGLNFSFKIIESAKNIINIQDWDKFRISNIAIPSRNRDSNKTMEVFINENTKTILLVWYQGNDILNYNYRYSSTIPGKGILDPLVSPARSFNWRGFDDDYERFSHVKTPFAINNSAIIPNIFNIYGTDNTYDDIASPFLQINLNFGNYLFSIFNAYAGNNILGTGFLFNKGYNTFRQYIDYAYNKSSATYGNLVTNLAYSYMKNENLYRASSYDDPSIFGTCDSSALNYILDYNNIEYYIFRGDTLYTNSNFSSNPITITINTPRTYRDMVTYNGWYKPKFNNILEFSFNEDQTIVNTTELDFIYSNTNLRSYNNIPQIWFNKIVSDVTSYDTSMGNAIDYQKNYNPFKSQWDLSYYHLYTEGVKTSIDGYNSTLELPSYFGSKLIKLPQSLLLDSWKDTTTNEEYKKNKISFSFNLTRSIVDIFKNEETFIDNWLDFAQSNNIIDGYIKKTILSYYNISKTKIKVEIWTKPYVSGSRLSYSLDDSFTKWEGANIDGKLNYINNEYVYIIDVKTSPALVYYIKFTLFEK